MRVSVAFVLNDLWIGAFWKRDGFVQHLYICLLPCCCIQINWCVRVDETVKLLSPFHPGANRQELAEKARAIVASWDEISTPDVTEN